jgi:molybdopterin-guanine dinucleotide biosynthesis protein A
MGFSCSGVILAGGLNTRFSGKNKAFIQIDGIYILDRLLGLFHSVFDEIILVTNDPSEYLSRNVVIATDIFPVRSSLTGIHSGLFYSAHPFAFVTACDTPFLKKELIDMLIDQIDSDKDVIIPKTSAGLEPLCAVYSKRCLKTVEYQLSREHYKISALFDKLRIKAVQESVLKQKDPELASFFNINTPDDLLKAQQSMR